MNKRLIQTFQDIVRIDSVSGEEDEISQYLQKLISKVGISYRVDDYGNIIASIEGTGVPLFFSAHMDTVEPGRNIMAVIKDGYLVSKGETILGADNKAAIAAIIETVYVITEGSIQNRPLEIIFTRSEETGNYGALALDESLIMAKEGYCFDSSQAVGTMVMSSPAYERFELEILGKDAHASRPEEGINALTILSRIIQDFPMGRINEQTVINIGLITGGSARNTVLGRIQCSGEIRSFNEEALNKYKINFENVVSKATKALTADYKLSWVRENGAYVLTNSEAKDFVERTRLLITSIGLEAHESNPWGVSDANIFNDKGLFCMNLADGTEFSHTVEERIKITELEEMHRLMVRLATNES